MSERILVDSLSVGDTLVHVARGSFSRSVTLTDMTVKRILKSFVEMSDGSKYRVEARGEIRTLGSRRGSESWYSCPLLNPDDPELTNLRAEQASFKAERRLTHAIGQLRVTWNREWIENVRDAAQAALDVADPS